MILAKNDTGVDTELVGETMGVKADEVLYNILSDKMYENKIKAVIRELSTNAVDSHIEAGNTDTPIKVTLPTIIEPTFKVRDYGVGLAPTDIMNLYTYGLSTKRNTNKLNGALGLGSKSPFAYSGAFTTTSYWNGKKYVFSIYSNNGKPTVVLMGESDTDEPNGIEVAVPVLDADIERFYTEAKEVYKFFDFPIDSNVDLGKKISELKPLYGKDNWNVYKEVSGSYIVMANVAYKIPNIPNSDGSNILYTNGLVVRVPTGVVEFSASRESLSMTPNTIAYLGKLADKIKKDTDDIVENMVGSASKTRELMVLLDKIPQPLRKKVKLTNNNLSVGYDGTISINVPNGYDVKTQYYSWDSKYTSISRITAKYFNGDYVFVLLDIENRRKYIQDTETKKIVFVKSTEKKTKENAKSRYDNFIKALELKEGEYKYSSDYTVPKTVRSGNYTSAPYSKIKNITEIRWDSTAKRWLFYTLPATTTTIEQCKQDNDCVLSSSIVSRSRYVSISGEEFQNMGLAPYKFIFRQLPDAFDKTKRYVFVDFVPSEFKKQDDVLTKNFWTRLVPKKHNFADATELIKSLTSLGFKPYRNNKGEYVIDDDTKKYLPKDLEREFKKLNSGRFNLIVDYSDKLNVSDLLKLMNRVHRPKAEYTVLGITLDQKTYEKYKDILGLKRGYSTKMESLARVTKAYDIAYKKLSKLTNN